MRVPATAANLGPGFDSLGLALALFNEVEVHPITESHSTSAAEQTRGRREDHTIEGQGAQTLPRGPENLVRRSMAAVAERVGGTLPSVAVRQANAIPLARGLGSSSAAIVGGCLAANELLGRPLSLNDLLLLCTELEGHPDNVAPALRGGLTVCYSSPKGIGCLKLTPVNPPRAVVAIPNYEVQTEAARRALPTCIPFSDAVLNVGHAAAVTAAFASGQYEALATAMDDRLHQPYRAHLVPGMEEAIQSAVAAGALGACLSGSGPTIIAFAHTREAFIAEAMQQALARVGIEAQTRILEVCTEGATVTCL